MYTRVPQRLAVLAALSLAACGESPSCDDCVDAGAIDATAASRDASTPHDASASRDGSEPAPDAGVLDAGDRADGGAPPPDGGEPVTASCDLVPGTCADGHDDDLDGLTDCEDSDCAGACLDAPLAIGTYAMMSSGAFTDPYRIELRGDGTCRWRTSSLPETWSECEHELDTSTTPPRLRLTDPDDGAVVFEWVIVRRDGDALRMHPPDRDWEEKDYGLVRSLSGAGGSDQYVFLGALEDGAENPVGASAYLPGGFELSMRAGDRLVFSRGHSTERFVFGPRASASDPGPLLPSGSGTLAGFDVVAEAPADGTYLLVTSADVTPHRFDAAGEPYRFLFDRGFDIDEGYATSGAAIGDVTGDGRSDVLIASGTYMASVEERCSLFIYDQRADGTLTDAPRQLPYTASSCYSSEAEDIEIVDLNGDGENDVVLLANGQLQASLASSTGALGAFYEASEAFGGTWHRMVVFHDDDDGAPDVAHVTTGTLRILGNDGAGTFTVRRTIAIDSDGRHGIMAGDVDGDGRDDVVVVSGQGLGPAVNVVLGGASAELALTGYEAPGVGLVGGVGPLDCDDAQDELVLGDATLPILRVAASGALTPLAHVAPDRAPISSEYQLFVRDMDGDGRAELVQNHRNGILYWFRTEAGWRHASFALANPLNYEVQAMAIGDYDDDGCPDAVLPSFNLGTALVRGHGCR